MNQQQKQTKGGFKMKPTRFLIVALVLMGLVATTSAATQAFTDITNQAFGNYKDANGNALAQVESGIVTTTVSQVAGVSLGSNLASPISAMDSTLYAVTLSNTGNYQDTFTIGATGLATGGTFEFYVYHDADGSGTINGAEGDTEITSSGLIVFEGDYDLLIKVVDVTSLGAASGNVHTVKLTATSVFEGDSLHVIDLVSTIQAAAVTGAITIIGDNTPEPGDPVVYQSCFTNTGTETAYNPVFTTTMPSHTTLSVTSVKINNGSAVSIKSTGSAFVPVTDSPYHYDTVTRILTMELDTLGTDTGNDDEVCIEFTTIVDAPLPAGTLIDFPANSPELTYENAGGDEYPGTNPLEDGAKIPAAGVPTEQIYGVSLDNGGVNGTDPYEYTGDPSDTLIFDFTVTNNGNGTDNFTFDDTTDYVTWVFYPDTNMDGILDTDEFNAGPITETGDLTSGQVVYFIAIGTIPVGTADEATDTSIIAAISQGAAPGVVTGTDTNSTICTAPILTLVKNVSPSGNQPPGTELEYTIVVANSGTGVATTVVVTDAIPTNTTYVAESMTIDGTGDDDALNAAGDHAFKAASSVIYDFDTIPAVTGANDLDQRILTFKVTID